IPCTVTVIPHDDVAEALRHWRSVRSLLADLLESPESLGLGLMARIQILGFGFRMGLDPEEFVQVFDEGTAMAKQANNLHALGLMMTLRDTVNAVSGKIDQMVSDMPETLRVAEETGDPGLKLVGRAGLVYAHIGSGSMQEAWNVASEVIENPPDDPNLGAAIMGISPYIQTHFLGCFALTYLGRIAEARRLHDRCIELAEANGQAEIGGWVRGTFNLIAYLTGDPEGTLEAVRPSIEIAEKIGSALSLVTARWSLGVAHVVRKEWKEAREVLERALEMSRSSQAGRFMEGRVLSYLSGAYLALGEQEEALRTAEEAVALSQARHTPNFECSSHLAVARARIAIDGAGAREAIETSLAEAERLAGKIAAVYWIPFIEEARADLAKLTGDDTARALALREAHRLFTDMDATVNAERIGKELGL
ncbi:MAG: tetratricopeptide repeat protein, partial [Myxococcota bacterium]